MGIEARSRQERFDVVVVGSGFGGSVAACRLSEAGMSVCVLERGKGYPPGAFARTPWELSRAFWDPSAGKQGLFQIWTFKGIEALVSSGLGGGSLIYANVLIRKDRHWFADGGQDWPISYDDLEAHYDTAERMLGATPYPDRPPFDRTPKTSAMQEAAAHAGVEWFRPNLAVTFGDESQRPGDPIGTPDENLHGVQRFTCRLTGECDLGCNFGSKNTLDLTYLSEAKRQDAELRTRCEVRDIRPRASGGFEVSYVEHTDANEHRATDTARLPKKSIEARRVIVAAGALGSTYLLLMNKKHDNLPALSDALGTRFCGNGDFLGFMKNARTPEPENDDRILEPSIGPVITSTVRVDPPGGRGYYIQDGGYPLFASWMRSMTKVPNTLIRGIGFGVRWIRNRFSANPWSNMSREVSHIIEPGGRASGSFLPVLGMGRDIPDGRMTLNAKDYLENDWTIKTSRPFFEQMTNTMRDLARGMNADFRRSPTWYFKRAITVHPLGGCPMGVDHTEGVVDQYGEVFRYPGLYVMDGSVMPGPVGPNPSLTIAAFAERACQRIIEALPPV